MFIPFVPFYFTYCATLLRFVRPLLGTCPSRSSSPMCSSSFCENNDEDLKVIDVTPCNAPDTTFHIRNSNSCLFRRCDMIFPPWLGFVCCFAFCSCYASHLIASCTLHRRRFYKTCIRSCFPGPLRCPFGVQTHSHAPAAPPKYYFISGIKMFSELFATCHAVLL